MPVQIDGAEKRSEELAKHKKVKIYFCVLCSCRHAFGKYKVVAEKQIVRG